MGDDEQTNTGVFSDKRVLYIVEKIYATYPKLKTGGAAKFDKVFQTEENV